MPRFEKNGRVVETALPRLAVRLRADGWSESKARTKKVKEQEVAHTEHVHAPWNEETQVVVHEDTSATNE